MGLSEIDLFRAKAQGVGTVGDPKPMGTFVADILQNLLDPKEDRYKYKTWLANHLMYALVNTVFDEHDRNKFVEQILEQFGRHGTWETDKKYLLGRLERLIEEFENQ